MTTVHIGPTPTRLADYRAPAWLIDTVDLVIDLDGEQTRVASTLQVRRNPAGPIAAAPLVLDGRDQRILGVWVDGREIPAAEQDLSPTTLALHVPEQCVLRIESTIQPCVNHSGLGMFVAGGGVIATHCEPEGFRRITYFTDRPDVLAVYTVTLRADRGRYPVLLSNGNRVASGADTDGRHWTRWHDPYPKPCYLFAIVAGDVASLDDRFVTRSGRPVALKIHASPDKIASCRHAMESLQRAMRWDETEYGLEYDLDAYHIVALDDHVGAQENKGLNVFDAQTIVADPDVATDDDYMLIERIVGHEYFHNWTGNRVTCRDWFQLSLKEGLTRFRDQEFSCAMSAAAEKRIETVRRIRSDQFLEDAGPATHPVKPEAYVEVANLYTATVYDKGAELIRMLRMLVGAPAYRHGVALYLARHDGRAATTEDFVRAIEDASQRDLTQFRLWYHQAGTPLLEIEEHYDSVAQTYRLRFRQSCPATPGQPRKEPMHVPVAIGLLDREGRSLFPQLRHESSPAGERTRLLEIRHPTEEFEFVGVRHAPVLSVLRDFTAPVRVTFDRSAADEAFLAVHDVDPVSRWDNAQSLATRAILGAAADLRAARPPQLDLTLHGAYAEILARERDPGIAALLLQAPEENALGAAATPPIDLDSIVSARRFVIRELARSLRGRWLEHYERLTTDEPYRAHAEPIARRRLRNLCLSYLAASGHATDLERIVAQVSDGGNVTDRLAALSILADVDCPQRLATFDRFYERWGRNGLIVNKWFHVQAISRLPGTVERVRELLAHPAFDVTNPAKGYALIGGFCRRNYVQFHEPGGSGYRLFADVLLMADRLKPESVHWLVPQAMQWRRFDEARQRLMQAEFARILATPGVSRGLQELIGNAIRQPPPDRGTSAAAAPRIDGT